MKTTSDTQKVKINDRKAPYRWIKVQHHSGLKIICDFGLADICLREFLARYIGYVSPLETGHLNFMFFDITNQPYKHLHVRFSACKQYLDQLEEKRLCQ